jgi:hypothetical protein
MISLVVSKLLEINNSLLLAARQVDSALFFTTTPDCCALREHVTVLATYIDA